jgi:small subunit ribosomal protein S7
MPRRRVAERREVLPIRLQQPAGDEIHQRRDVGRQEECGREHFLRCDAQIGDKTGEEPLKVFKRAIDNVKPTVEVKSRRVGGSTYQVPIEVHQERRGALAIRWIVSYARGAVKRR